MWGYFDFAFLFLPLSLIQWSWFRVLATLINTQATIMVRSQHICINTMHHIYFNSSFCWFQILSNGNSFSLLIWELGMLQSGGVSTWEVQCPNFEGENSRTSVNWLCLARAMLKALFGERRFSSAKRLRSFIGQRWRLCTVSSLEASLLETWTSHVVMVVFVLLL
jgi:hypothetical protein